MKRVIKIKNSYGSENKDVLVDEYEGFGIYQKNVHPDISSARVG